MANTTDALSMEEKINSLQEEVDLWKQLARKNMGRLVEVIYWYEGDKEKVMKDQEESDEESNEDEESDEESDEEEDYSGWSKKDLQEELKYRGRCTKEELVAMLQLLDNGESQVKRPDQSWKKFWKESSDDWKAWWKMGLRYLEW